MIPEIIEKREAVILTITKYYNNGEHEFEEANNIRSSLIALFLELGSHIKDFYGEEKHKIIRNKIYTKPLKLSSLEEAYELLDEVISPTIS